MSNPKIKKVDWELRKKEWIDAVDNLYNKVDDIIVANFRKAGYQVTTKKEEIKITENFVGTYITHNYSVKADHFGFHFSPIGTIRVDFKGYVHMAVPWGGERLILTDKNEWKIVEGMYMVAMKLLDFNERNIQKVFERNFWE